MTPDDKFIYPVDLAPILLRQWQQFQESFRKTIGKTAAEAPDPLFPEQDCLVSLLDILYHVSFLTEESRRITLRIGYLSPASFKTEGRQYHNLNVIPYLFPQPIPFTTEAALRLAPAIDPAQSMLLICAASSLGSEDDASLKVWGVLHMGSDWWRVVTGRAMGGVCPPNCCTLSTFGPGNLTASTLGTVLFRLDQGKPIAPTSGVIDAGQIGDFFKVPALELCSQVGRLLVRDADGGSEGFESYPFRQYHNTLANIVRLAAEEKHGATFIVLPDHVGDSAKRLSDLIDIKYRLDNVKIWDALVRESVLTKKLQDALRHGKVAGGARRADNLTLAEYVRLNRMKDKYERRIHEYEEFVASLSGVDGAVLLNRKLELRGFGCEIITTGPSPKTIKVAMDKELVALREKDANSFGTRHRSVFRLCSVLRDCVAFVISQDGAVRAVKKVDSDIVLWPNVNIGEFGL